jgi:hypothetical protein
VNLEEQMALYYDEPLAFVLHAYPWGVPGPLEGFQGPDEHQQEFLVRLGQEVKQRAFDGHTPVMPIRMTKSEGHGTGKTALGAWLTDWIISTRPHSQGTVTAGTFVQLSSKTWAQVKWWTNQCITKDWFDIQETGIFHKEHPDSWYVTPQTCKAENAQSFAGQHAHTSTSWYWFDESSVVPDEVWKVAYGGLTGGEPMFFAWGQPERNTGEFYEICFGKYKNRWINFQVDSRTSTLTNKALIDEWIKDYGIDSDWVKVRVLGQPPGASELQFIDKQRIIEAGKRDVWATTYEPLICGFDVSGGGSAWNVIRFRRGLDGATRPAIRMNGETPRETLIGVAAMLLAEQAPDQRIAMMFIDSAFGSPIVERLHVLGYQNVVEVNFGGKPADFHCLNTRASMANACKDWLLRGHIDAGDSRLTEDLASAGYKINISGKLVIESKQEIAKRLGRSPDDSDALWLTFAQPVAPVQDFRNAYVEPPLRSGDSWMS